MFSLMGLVDSISAVVYFLAREIIPAERKDWAYK
jgi:hypothetical protein